MAKRSEEDLRRQRTRNWIILAIIVTFIALVYLLTILKMGQFWIPGE